MARTRPRAFQVRLTDDELDRWHEHARISGKSGVAQLVRDATERLIEAEIDEQIAATIARSHEPAAPASSSLPAELEAIVRMFGER